MSATSAGVTERGAHFSTTRTLRHDKSVLTCGDSAVTAAPASSIDRITIDLDVCDGRPVVRHMRIAVESILDYLSAGETPEEIIRQQPMLEPEDISACLAFASRLMSRKYSVKETA